MDEKAKPMLFSTDMVRAILNGSKMMTRRALKPQPMRRGKYWDRGAISWPAQVKSLCPEPYTALYNIMPYKPGDVLWVRETWALQQGIYWHKVELLPEGVTPPEKWRPAIHMPREAARLFLRVTEVRAERLHSITAEDAMQEGVTNPCKGCPDRCWLHEGDQFTMSEGCYTDAFARLWDGTIRPKDHGEYGWETDPWVWVVSFEQCEKPAGF